MKAIFISYNQAHTEKVQLILDNCNVRGYTRWEVTQGRGTLRGEPHLGNHTWPAMNSSILAVVEDHKVEPVLDRLRKIDESAPQHGLRAFVFPVEQMI